MAAPKLKIRTGDEVVIRTGKDAGKRGRVVHTYPETGRVVVEGVNVVKRHTKARPSMNPANAAAQAQRPESQGGVIEKEAAVHVSNVAIICPDRDKPARVGYRIKDDGRKVRVARIGGVAVDIDK